MPLHNAENIESVKDHFEFDKKHLLKFCRRFEEDPMDNFSESLLEIKLKDLEARWQRLDTSHEAVMLSRDEQLTPGYREEVEDNYEICMEAYYKCSSQIMELIKNFRFEPINPEAQSTSRYGPRYQRTFVQDNFDDCIKLPPCDTEVFKGSYEQWPSFRDMFTAVYINHSRLTPVTKLYHLRNKTKGEAGAIVKRYPLSHNNFELAWTALKNRYENKRVLVDNQINILFDIPAAKSEDSESIRRIQSSVNDSLATLRTLGIEVGSWDPILIRLISSKLPDTTLSLWEQSLNSPRELPTWQQMSQFLMDRYEAVERVTSIKNLKDGLRLSNPKLPNIQTYLSQDNLNSMCKLCKQDHHLRTCPKFRSFTVQQRIDYVYQNKICNNCLGAFHNKANCKSRNTCLICKKPHHSLLHMASKSQNMALNTEEMNRSKSDSRKTVSQSSSSNVSQTAEDANIELPSTSRQIHANCSTSNENILLRTALTEIESRGERFILRALIDPGSQRTFLSEKARNRLRLPYIKSHFEIIGIGGKRQIADKECELTLYAKRTNQKIPIRAIVLPKVTRQLPEKSFKIPVPNKLLELDLADPTFNKSSQIDLILGNDYEQFINIDGMKRNICGNTSAYNTIFGWVLSGPMRTQSIQSFTTSVETVETPDLNSLLRKFWEDEEIPLCNTTSVEDKLCEQLYSQNTTRQEDGRYVVRLPFKIDYPDKIFLGSSRFVALAQYSSMEKSLAKNPDLQSEYRNVLQEYLTLDHMEETLSQEIFSNGKYESFYLPHHAVIRPDHKTTKVRVVFNASRKSKSQYSLNDILYTGPTLQNDLMTIILNWRKYKYVFSGDIQKMYRQILIHPKDRSFQKILFQNHPNEPIKDYQLKTVTFGINCAPYLAIRTLLKLASDCEHEYPQAAEILRSQIYVDDILSGNHSIEETLSAQSQLISALKSGGFPLKKITANDPRLISHLPKQDLYDENFLKFKDASATKTLGIKWNALLDAFSYNYSPISQSNTITKRKILSSVAKLFDPAGWIAPIIIRAKILMQQLWLEGLEWDEDVSIESLKTWNELVTDLSMIETVSIPRWLQYTPSDKVQIHGFCDASKQAYCATVYIRCETTSRTVFTNLLVARSKVAPIQTVCLPRLELNGAWLLSKLMKYVLSSLSFNETDIYLWTDSSIVLGWLSKSPSSWETYVANRTAQIHQNVPQATWRHVPTHYNPADLGTRGCKCYELANNQQWWYGPPWLQNPSSEWPNKKPVTIVEKAMQINALHTKVSVDDDILNMFSSYNRALRVLAYVFRFLSKNIEKSKQDELTQQEIHNVKTKLIIIAQKSYYSEEYQQLSTSKNLKKESQLKTLNPFLDSNLVLRANGRLSRSSLPYNERFPIILPGNSRFCQLYLSHLHQFLGHAEGSQMCRMVQTEFFIFRLKPRVKKIIRNCKTCIINRQQSCSQIMAPLPPERCTLTPPFQVTGVDFAGPFELKSSRLRKAPTTKGYACVFVCFSTKAVHLETCSDLSSAAFQAAFDRFVGRRGLPQRVVTDNGRNFLGASRILEDEFSTFVKTASQEVAQKYIVHGFEWKFIPPHAPHMGGLWEAAVKSFKFHLKRIAGAQKFTFEEFSTILARIEGILNSRPISAMSEDPTDLTALTPGHFLRGAPLMSFPEQDCQKMSVINRWQKLKVIHQQLAIQWKVDYIKSLHKRYKWKDSVRNIQKGDLVVVIDDLSPPHEWRLGRIENTYPGPDHNVRTVDVRTASGLITRPVVKLCYLPFLNEENANEN